MILTKKINTAWHGKWPKLATYLLLNYSKISKSKRFKIYREPRLSKLCFSEVSVQPYSEWL